MPGMASGPGVPAPFGAGSANALANAPAYIVPSSRLELKTGSVMVYGDNEVSVEEKRAKNPKYAALAAPVAVKAEYPPAPHGIVTPAPAMNAAQAPIQVAVGLVPAVKSEHVDPLSQSAGQKRARATDFI